ncbi:hypothetical protein [Thauera humireducens]|uniref:hypothetical protein n=1 Tax=Thauera humireducens TaxID=1134435 RepID=UPI00311E6BFC
MQLDDVRATQAPPFEEVKPQLQQRLQQQKVEKHVIDLREGKGRARTVGRSVSPSATKKTRAFGPGLFLQHVAPREPGRNDDQNCSSLSSRAPAAPLTMV